MPDFGIGFLLLIAAVVLLPVWLSRSARKRMKERFAPVPAKSTTVVLDAQPATPPSSQPLPSMLSQVVIRTGQGGGRRHLYSQASGYGMDPHVQDTHDASHGHGHGDADGV